MVSKGLSLGLTTWLDAGANGLERRMWTKSKSWRQQKLPCLKLGLEGARAAPLLGSPGLPCPVGYAHDTEVESGALQRRITEYIPPPHNLELVEPGVGHFLR